MVRMVHWRLGEEDIAFLNDVGVMEIKAVATKWKLSEGATRSKIHRIRERITRFQWYVNNVRALQKANPRIRKLTTKGSLEEQWKEEEHEEGYFK